MGQFLDCPTFVKKYGISRFFDRNTAKNMIKYYGLFYSAKNKKSEKYHLQKPNTRSIIKEKFRI